MEKKRKEPPKGPRQASWRKIEGGKCSKKTTRGTCNYGTAMIGTIWSPCPALQVLILVKNELLLFVFPIFVFSNGTSF